MAEPEKKSRTVKSVESISDINNFKNPGFLGAVNMISFNSKRDFL